MNERKDMNTFTGYNLQRFITRQDRIYETVLEKIKNAEKISIWICYIFPQIRGIGETRKAYVFGLDGLAEARAYLAQPVLGKRLNECCEALLTHKDKTAQEILGEKGAAKLWSCATLFNIVSEENFLFQNILDQFFDGKTDSQTMALLNNTNHFINEKGE